MAHPFTVPLCPCLALQGRIVTALAAAAAVPQRRGATSMLVDEGGDATGSRRDPGLPRRAEQLRDITAAAAASCGASAAELHWHRVRYVAAPSSAAGAETDPSRRLLPSPLWHPRATDVLLVTYSLGADADAAHCRVARAPPLGPAALGPAASSSQPTSAVAAVITPAALRRCAAVHAFLLRLRRARFELGRARLAVGRAGPPLRQQQRERQKRLPPAKGAAAAAVDNAASLFTPLPPSASLLLYEAWHVVTALDAYVAGQAANACHARLLGEAAAAESPAALHAAFEAHSRRLLERCLLPPVEGGGGTGEAAAATPLHRGRAAALAAAAAAVDAALAVSLRFCYAVHVHAASAGGGSPGSPELLTPPAVAAFTAELRRHVDVLARGVARALAAGAAGADDSHLRDLAARLAGCVGQGRS